MCQCIAARLARSDNNLCEILIRIVPHSSGRERVGGSFIYCELLGIIPIALFHVDWLFIWRRTIIAGKEVSKESGSRGKGESSGLLYFDSHITFNYCNSCEMDENERETTKISTCPTVYCMCTAVRAQHTLEVFGA